MKHFFSIIVFCISLAGFGQEYFNKRFDFYVPGGLDGALNVLEVDDGYVINGGTGDQFNPYWRRLAITKLDHSGEIVWQKNWGDTISQYYFTGRGSLLRVNDEIMLTKFNEDFDTLWTAYYGEEIAPYDTGYIPRNFTNVVDGFIVTGAIYPNGLDSFIFLLKTDSLGNPVWVKYYGSSDYLYLGYSVITTSDGGYAIGGYKFVFGPYGAPIGDPIVIKTDSLGNFEWEMNLGGPYQDDIAILCNSEDGNFIIASRYDTDSIHESLYKSRVQLTKVGNSGNLIWNKFIGKHNKYTRLENIRSNNNDGYIINGSHGEYPPPAPDRMGFLLNTDKNGDSLWYRQYSILNGYNSLNFFNDAIPTSDGGYLAGGYCLPVHPDTGSQDAWAIKVDSLGCEGPWDCWVDIEEIEDESINFKDDIKIYPNPATNRINIEVDEPIKSVAVYDLNGRIQAVEFIKPDLLDISLLKKGMYFIMINQRQGIKFIKN